LFSPAHREMFGSRTPATIARPTAHSESGF
jgi:hypothetical protein